MNKVLAAEIERLGGDPTDEVWRWFVLNGPHGPNFTWGQSRNRPAGYVGVEHLRDIVTQKTEMDLTFPTRARAVVSRAFESANVSLLRRAIQIAAVVGSGVELERVRAFAAHGNDAVAADARASAFYLRERLRATPSPD